MSVFGKLSVTESMVRNRPPVWRSHNHSAAVVNTVTLHAQREPACPCGGDCPRCRSAMEGSLKAGELDDAKMATGQPGRMQETRAGKLSARAMMTRAPAPQAGCSFADHSPNGPEDDEGYESLNTPIRSATQGVTRSQAPPPCPAGTRVDTTTDLTQAGLQAGFRSAYGIIARMRVLPDQTNWDGAQISESLSQTSSTCPPGLTVPGPCSGNSTFTVGAASGGSAVSSRQPGMRNRFYDFHTSRSRTVSFLHDVARNPTRMNSCETVCLQLYYCNGAIIGMHPITRHFRKGTFNGQDVTIIDVTKQNPVSDMGDFPERTLPSGQEYAGRDSEPEQSELA